MRKKKNLTAIILALVMIVTLLMPSNLVHASNENINAGENDAVSYTIEKEATEDGKKVDITLNLKSKDNITVTSLLLPDGTEQEYAEEIKYAADKNEKLTFSLNYTENDEAEIKESAIDVEITEIEEAKAESIQSEETESVQKNSIPEDEPEKVETETSLRTQKADLKNNAINVDITEGNIVIDTNGVSVNGTIQPDSISDSYILSGTSANTVTVNTNVQLILNNLNISATTANPMTINGDVEVLLAGENTLQTTNRASAALRVQPNKTLTISSADGDGKTTGKLSAFNLNTYNGARGAGIGADQTQSGIGNIIINGGTIEAKGAHGIGGVKATTGSITINGGDVTAFPIKGDVNTVGNQYGVGIGGQSSSNAFSITINGGKIYATGGSGGPGIGQAQGATPAKIMINGGEITATGGYEAAGIGAGQTAVMVDITITDGIINAAGGNVDIGMGGQESGRAGSVINISGGTINCLGTDSATASIGDGSSKTGSTLTAVNMTGGTITGNSVYLVVAKTVDIQDTTFNAVNVDNASYGSFYANDTLNIDNAVINARSGFSGTNGVTITDTKMIAEYDKTQNYFPGSIMANNGEVHLKNNTMGTIKNISAKGSIDIVESKFDLSFYSIVNAIESKNDSISIEKSDLTIETGTLLSATKATKAIGAFTEVKITDSKINATVDATEDSFKWLVYGENVTLSNDTIVSNAQAYASQELTSSSGYYKSTNTISGMRAYSISISGGYHDYAGAVSGTRDVSTGDNAIVFASEYKTTYGSLNLVKSIIFTNENNTDTPKNGYVYGSVDLSYLIEENGKQFTLPEGYTLTLDETHKSGLNVGTDKTFINQGTIENYKKINMNTGSAFTNEAAGKVTNHYGGYFVTDGTMTNKGTVKNAVYMTPIRLDNQAWTDYDEDTFILKSTNGEITYVTDYDNHTPVFYADYGNNRILVNGNDTGKDIETAWSYLDYPVDLYTIHYDANYDSAAAIDQADIALADSVYELQLPSITREEYTLKEWNTKADGTGNTVGSTITVNEPTILYAIWEQNAPDVEIWTVTFDFKGGSFRGEVNPEFEINIFSDSSRLITVYPYDTFVTKEGYTFTGWYSDEACTQKWDFENDNVAGNMTLYAKWNINTYHVTYEFISDKNPDGITVPEKVTVDYQSTINEPKFTVPEKWTFDGWYTNKECTNKFNFDTAITSDMTLYGKWNKEDTQIKPEQPNTPNDSNKPDHSGDSVQTGDTTQTGLYFAGMSVSILLLLTFVIRKRKHAERRD